MGEDGSKKSPSAAEGAPPRKRKGVCALDLGAARIGLAVTDELGAMAHPRGTFAARPRPAFLAALATLVKEEEIGRIIVGFPLDLRGTEGEAARRARMLAQDIADATDCDVELFDERLTTVQAQRSLTASGLNRKESRAHIDEASAAAILQAWLDARAARRAAKRHHARTETVTEAAGRSALARDDQPAEKNETEK